MASSSSTSATESGMPCCVRCARRSASSSPGTRIRSVPGASADACTSSMSWSTWARKSSSGRNRVTSSTTKLAPLVTRSQPVSSDSLCSVAPKLLSASSAGHDLDQEADAEALVPAEPLQLRDRRRVGVGGGVARARRSPTPRGWSRRRACGPGGSCSRPRRWWRCRRRRRGAGRPAPRTRTGWSRTGWWCRRTAARSWRRSGTPSRSTRRPTPASCSRRGHRDG